MGHVFCRKNLVDVDDVKVSKEHSNKYKIIKWFTGFRFCYRYSFFKSTTENPQQQEHLCQRTRVMCEN